MSLPGSWLRRLSWLEAVSFLLLLGVAVPLKHLADRPGAVHVLGWIHGALFFTVFVMAWVVKGRRRWGADRAIVVIVAALLPCGPFLFDGKIARWEAEQAGG